MDFYIDLGSSTIKVYQYLTSLELIEEYSIHFKDGFTEDNGISKENRDSLCNYFSLLLEKYDMRYENTHIYLTGIFRNMSSSQRQNLTLEFHRQFDLHISIISHDIENYYIGKAMDNDYQGKKVMIINMGGKTTELVTFKENKIVGRTNLKIGVADLLNEFPEVNDSYSSVSVDTIKDYVKSKLENISFDQDYACAIFTGGEERFELLTDFLLVRNEIFDDGIHQYMIDFNNYVEGTEKVFSKMSLQELYNLMPKNSKWMDGARAGAVLPLAIFELANINYIVPSDLNLIHGVINDQKSL